MDCSDKNIINGSLEDFEKELVRIKNDRHATMTEKECFDMMHKMWT